MAEEEEVSVRSVLFREDPQILGKETSGSISLSVKVLRHLIEVMNHSCVAAFQMNL